MRFACLVYGPEQTFDTFSPDEQKALNASAIAYDKGLTESGHLIVAQALQSTRSSKSVRVRKRKAVITDGPFAETKEQLLGFLLLEARDMAEALDIAAKSPLAELGTIEVRPAYDYRE